MVGATSSESFFLFDMKTYLADVDMSDDLLNHS